MAPMFFFSCFFFLKSKFATVYNSRGRVSLMLVNAHFTALENSAAGCVDDPEKQAVVDLYWIGMSEIFPFSDVKRISYKVCRDVSRGLLENFLTGAVYIYIYILCVCSPISPTCSSFSSQFFFALCRPRKHAHPGLLVWPSACLVDGPCFWFKTPLRATLKQLGSAPLPLCFSWGWFKEKAAEKEKTLESVDKSDTTPIFER